MPSTDPERQGDGYVPEHRRPLKYEVPVSPRLRIGVDDSHSLVVCIMSAEGDEQARTTLSNGDHLAEAVIVARAWVATQDDTAEVERVMEATSSDLNKRRPQ